MKDYFTDSGKTEPIGGFGNYGKTEPTGGFPGFGDNYGGTETEPNGQFGDVKTMPNGFNGFNDQKPTDFGGWGGAGMQPEDIPTQPIGSGSPRYGGDTTKPQNEPDGFPFEDIGPTQVVGPDEGSFFGYMPVVGWLVCIEGNDRGRDFRLHAGYNTIGRNPGNDVCITGDNAIARERHAMIAYDQEESLFFFAPGNGVNLVRLNGKVLMTPSEIKANDVLSIGRSKLMFIPLCTEAFNWGKQS